MKRLGGDLVARKNDPGVAANEPALERSVRLVVFRFRDGNKDDRCAGYGSHP